MAVQDNDEKARLARRIIKMQADYAELGEAIEFQKQKLAEYGVTESDGELVGSNDEGYLRVTTYQHKVFNEAYGKKNHPDLWEKAAEPKLSLDSKLAKTKLTDEEYALFQKPSDKLSVKIEVVVDDD